MASSRNRFAKLDKKQKQQELLNAAERGDVNAVQALLDLDTEINIRKKITRKVVPTIEDEFTPLMLAAANGHVEVMKVLLKHRVLFFVKACDIELKDKCNQTALQI